MEPRQSMHTNHCLVLRIWLKTVSPLLSHSYFADVAADKADRCQVQSTADD